MSFFPNSHYLKNQVKVNFRKKRVIFPQCGQLPLGSMERWMDGRTFMAITELSSRDQLSIQAGDSLILHEGFHEITQCPRKTCHYPKMCSISEQNCLTIQTFGWLSLNNECVRKTQRNLPCRIRPLLAFAFQSYSAKADNILGEKNS